MDVTPKCSSPNRTSALETDQDMATVSARRYNDPTLGRGHYSDNGRAHESSMWDGTTYGPNSNASSQPTSAYNNLQLPSIRNLIPEYISPLEAERSRSYNYASGRGTPMVEPAYETSPASKRRRISEEDTSNFRNENAYTVPRSQSRQPGRNQSPPQYESLPPVQSSISDHQFRTQTDSPYMYSNRSSISHLPIGSPIRVGRTGNPYDSAMSDYRPVRPTLPPMTPIEASQSRFNNGPEILREPLQRESFPRPYAPQWETNNPFQNSYGVSDYPYGIASENSYGNVRPSPTERSPFTAGQVYSTRDGHQFDMRGTTGDNKQRKRRGNLPKETTDKLRTWFHQHLSHPYPTEDEKQELMRNTGLQMNQISNWFINARRRQLPSLVNQNQNRNIETSVPPLSREHSNPDASDDNMDEEVQRPSGTLSSESSLSTATANAAPIYPFKPEHSQKLN